MATATAAQQKQEIARLAEVADIHRLAIGAMIDTTPSHVERFSIDGQRYTLKLYRPTDSHGGIVVVASKIGQQRTSIHVDYFDRLYREYYPDAITSLMAPFREALWRMRTARNTANAYVSKAEVPANG